jgi:hypothetical protein
MKENIRKLSCFITGFNYQIISRCSEIAQKMLKRYTGLIVLISIVWAIIGYSFAMRYLKLGVGSSLLMSALCVLSIILIERNIILAQKANKGMFAFRIILACIMAIIGSLILDQSMFAEDIEEARIAYIQDKIKINLPAKTAEIKYQIEQTQESIDKLEIRINTLSNDISLRPTIETISSTTQRTSQDSINRVSTTIIRGSEANPKIEELKANQESLKNNNKILQERRNELLYAEKELKKEYESRRGFLDELNIMWIVISKSGLSTFVYFMWLAFFLAIELFIVLSKIGESENDYHKLIHQQMELHNRRLDNLNKS